MKKIWLTMISKDQKIAQNLITKLKGYGLNADGHFWIDDLKKMAWIAPRDEIVNSENEGWLIYANVKELEKESIRYGLSLLVLTVTAQKGRNFPIILLFDKPYKDTGALPTPLASLENVTMEDSSVYAKIVAKLNKRSSGSLAQEYRIDVYGNPQIGQWFEIGPAQNQEWNGAIFGVSGADITFQAVGPRGRLPERSTLNYPVQGMKLETEKHNYIAWGVQNPISAQHSYFVRVDSWPDSIIFGQYPTKDKAELYSVVLK